MKKFALLITVAALIALIALAAFAYKSLSNDYFAEETTTVTETTTITETEALNDLIVTTSDFSVTDKNSNTVKLSDYFGKPIVVNFWATWCSPCKIEMPHFEDAYRTHGDDVQFLMVNVGDSFADTYKFGERNNYTFPIYHDSNYSASIAYNVSSIPCTLFINAKGELVHTQIGTMNKMMLETHIANIK